MESGNIQTITTNNTAPFNRKTQKDIAESDFISIYNGYLVLQGSESVEKNIALSLSSPLVPALGINSISGTAAVSRYNKIEGQLDKSNEISSLAKYKDDQLLSNPGGDYYYLEDKDIRIDSEENRSIWGRIKKDISDSLSNIKNFFGNILFGAKRHYRDENNEIKETKTRGLIGSAVDFLKKMGSALSLGIYKPDGEETPKGLFKRLCHSAVKIKEAVFGDLVQGVSGSLINIGEDLMFSGWNLVETLPDMTIGNFESGRRLTTNIFDNGQVVMDYLTDIIPSGEAWVRVHSMKLKDMDMPIVSNLNKPEQTTDDASWEYVRNTPFRKGIETFGSLLMDVLSLKIFGQIRLFSDDHHHKN